MQLSYFFFPRQEDALALLLSNSFSFWSEMGSCLIQPHGTKFCHDLLLDWLFPASPSPSCSSHSIGCLARRSRGNKRRYDAETGRRQQFSKLCQSFSRLSQAREKQKTKPKHNSLGLQLLGKNVFCWTRKIMEPPKLWRYKGFCITLPNNSPRSLCKYSHEWKLPSYFAGICNSFYSCWLFLAEIAHTKGE